MTAADCTCPPGAPEPVAECAAHTPLERAYAAWHCTCSAASERDVERCPGHGGLRAQLVAALRERDAYARTPAGRLDARVVELEAELNALRAKHATLAAVADAARALVTPAAPSGPDPLAPSDDDGYATCVACYGTKTSRGGPVLHAGGCEAEALRAALAAIPEEHGQSKSGEHKDDDETW